MYKTGAALFFVLASLAMPAPGCSFVAQPLAEQLNQADFVALVLVTEARLVDPDGARLQQAGLNAKFNIAEMFKGNAAAATTLHSGLGGGDCGLGLAPGHFLLLVGTVENHVVEANLMNGSDNFGLQNPVGAVSRERLRLDAIRAYLRSNTPIDACLDWGVVPPPPAPPEQPDQCRDWIFARLEALKH